MTVCADVQDTWEQPSRRYNEDEEDEEEDGDEAEDDVDRDVEDEGDEVTDNDGDQGNEVSPDDGLQDLQYFPNFYRLLRSLSSGKHLQVSDDRSTSTNTPERAVVVMAIRLRRMSHSAFVSHHMSF